MQKWLKILIVASLAGVTGYFAYLESNISSAILVVIFSSIVIGSLSSGLGIWNSISALKNPFVGMLTFFMLSFIYLSFQGGDTWISLFRSVGIGLIGAAISMILFNFWNIGG